MVEVIYLNKNSKEYSSYDKFADFFEKDSECQNFINNQEFISLSRYRCFSYNKWSFNRPWSKQHSLQTLINHFNMYLSSGNYLTPSGNEIDKFVCTLWQETPENINLDHYQFKDEKDYLIIVLQ